VNWDTALAAYDRDLRTRGSAERTRRAYGVDLAAFVGWFNYNDGGALNDDNTGWQAGVGTGINF